VAHLAASFWNAAAFNTGWLTDRLTEEEVTVDRWCGRPIHEAAARTRLTCPFLNRTTFSGMPSGCPFPAAASRRQSPGCGDCLRRYARPSFEPVPATNGGLRCR